MTLNMFGFMTFVPIGTKKPVQQTSNISSIHSNSFSRPLLFYAEVAQMTSSHPQHPSLPSSIKYLSSLKITSILQPEFLKQPHLYHSTTLPMTLYNRA